MLDKNRREPVVLVLVLHACLHRHVGKRSIAVVVEQMVRLALQSARAAVHRRAAILAVGVAHRLGPRNRQVVAVEVHIAGHVQVQPPVAVVVAPCRARRPVAQRHAGLLRHIGKRSVVVVVVKPVLAVVAHIDIGPAVVVVVGNAHAIAPAVVGHAGLGGHIGKGSVVVVVEQRGLAAASSLPSSASKVEPFTR